jgi:hypothetical protein
MRGRGIAPVLLTCANMPGIRSRLIAELRVRGSRPLQLLPGRVRQAQRDDRDISRRMQVNVASAIATGSFDPQAACQVSAYGGSAQ